MYKQGVRYLTVVVLMRQGKTLRDHSITIVVGTSRQGQRYRTVEGFKREGENVEHDHPIIMVLYKQGTLVCALSYVGVFLREKDKTLHDLAILMLLQANNVCAILRWSLF